MSSTKGTRFSDDCPIEALRGVRQLSNRAVKKALAKRAAWLQEKIGRRSRLGEAANFYLDELRAVAQAMEAFEAIHPSAEKEP